MNMWVKVASDTIVLRDPQTMRRVTTKGIKVKRSVFWIRRIKAGECVEIFKED